METYLSNMTDLMLACEREVAPMQREAHAERYTRMAQAWIGGQLRSPNETELATLKAQLAAEYPRATELRGDDPAILTVKWPRIWHLAQNPAFYWFMREWAHTSPIGVEWTLNVHRTSPRTLEVAFGYGWEFEKPERLTRIRRHDPYWWWAVATPTFHEARVRARKAADLLEATKAYASKGRPARALIVGAGRVPELRYAGFTFEPERLEITAIGPGLEFNLDRLLRQEAPESVLVETGGKRHFLASFLADHELSALGVRDLHLPVQEFLVHQADPTQAEAPFDLIVMNGLAIYLGAELPTVLRALCALLKPDGQLFFDYSFTAHWDLVRSVMVYGWGLPNLPEGATGQKQALAQITARFATAPQTPEGFLGLIGSALDGSRHLELTTEVDLFCEPTVAVYATITNHS